MMNIWTILIADNYWVKEENHTHTFTYELFEIKNLNAATTIRGLFVKENKGEGGKSIDSRKRKTDTLSQRKQNISVLCHLLFFLPLFFHVLLTVRSESVWNNIHSHTISYMIMEEQKINQDQGRKQTAERLNFRFYFYFFIIFYGWG